MDVILPSDLARNLSMSNQRKCLVTGGAGFIGSHLCDRLISDGHRVTCMDNFFTGQKRNIEHLQTNERFSLLEHNVQESYSGDFDWIFNLACPASPVHYQKFPVDTVKTNVMGMIQALELGKLTGARVFQASTSEIYGDPLVHPQTEQYWGNVNPLSKRACYDEGKRCAETLCFDYYREYGVDIRVIRIFNTYGPRMAENDGRVVSNFILQALRGEPIALYGDGSFTRSFQFVSDLIDGMMRMMEQGDFVGPVNIGNPDEFTIKELADLILELTGSSSRIIHLPEIEHDPKRRKPDIRLAKEKLAWAPTVALREGLKETVAYFKTVV